MEYAEYGFVASDGLDETSSASLISNKHDTHVGIYLAQALHVVNLLGSDPPFSLGSKI